MRNSIIRYLFAILLVIPLIFILCYISLITRENIHNCIAGKPIQCFKAKASVIQSGTSVANDPETHTNELAGVPYPFSISTDTVILGKDGKRKRRKRFLTIGIPSVWRKENYLSVTLDSILKETSHEEKLDIYIFLLLADADPKVRLQRAKYLNQRYSKVIEAGLLKVLQPSTDLYANINDPTRRTYNDSAERVKWRMKQVLDFAFLFRYTWTVQPSTYYLVLEDDVLSATNFVNAIQEFVGIHENHHWLSLELSGFIIIGQLLRCEDLNLLATFLLLFHQEHPVDFLLKYWLFLMAPERPPEGLPNRRVPGLFQHIGIHSTLANKTQTIKDDTFGNKLFSHANPEAKVVTTMRQYQSYGPDQVYSSAPGMFWGISKPGDTFDIIFTKRLNVSRVFVRTGAIINNKVRDRLDYGILEISGRFLQMLGPRRASCEGFITIQRFKKGSVDVRHLHQVFPEGIQCIRINIGTKQKSWIIITEMSVFTGD